MKITNYQTLMPNIIDLSLIHILPEIIPFSDLDMDILAKELGSIAREHGMTIQTCGTNGDFTRYGIQSSGCMTLDILGKANGILFKDLKHKGTRQGCHCIESRDIGAYDTCLNACKDVYKRQDNMDKLAEIFDEQFADDKNESDTQESD